MKKVKLTKDWKGHKAGAVLELDEDTFKEVIEAKVAEEYDEALEAKMQKAQDDGAKAAADAAVKAVEAKLATLDLGNKMVHIEVRDKSDDDPTNGFLEGNTKSADQLRPDEVCYAFGKMAADIYNAGNGKTESDILRKSRERSELLIRKAAGDGMVVGSDQEGGYLIFSAASQMLLKASLENAIVRPRASRMTLGTQILQLPYLRDDDHSSGTVFGGIHIYYDDELAAGSSSRPKLGRIELKLKKITAMGYASEEWIKWSPVSLGTWLIPRFGDAIGWKEDLSFLTGPGGAQPLGIANAPCAVSISGESGQDADTFVLENTTGMFSRLKPMKESSVVWMMNRTVFPQLPKLNVEVGSGGAAVFTTNIGDKPGQRIWGYPIVYTEKLPILGDAGSVILTDISDYLIADDQTGPEIAQSIHMKFEYGQTAFRIHKYIDGQNATAKALTPYKGSDLSPVVKIAAI